MRIVTRIILPVLLIGIGICYFYNNFSIKYSWLWFLPDVYLKTLSSLWLIAIGIGLLLRKPWARLAAIGLGWVVLVLVGKGLLLFTKDLDLGWLVFFPLSAFFLVLFLIAFILFLAILHHLSSEEAILYYRDTMWTGPILKVRNWDLRPALFIILFLFSLSFIKVIQIAHFHIAPKIAPKKKMITHQDKAQLEKTRIASEEHRMKRLSRHARIKQLAFTLDDRHLWLTMTDSKLHLLDLSTKDVKTFPFDTFHDTTRYLSSDGTFFFDYRKMLAVRTNDAVEFDFGFGRSFEFLGFAAKGTEALVYNPEGKILSLVDVTNKNAAWTLPIDQSVPGDSLRKLEAYATIWSADRKVAVLSFEKGFLLLDVENGKCEKPAFGFRYPEFYSSSAVSNEIVLSGPIGFTNTYKTYKIDTLTKIVEEVNTPNRVIGFDPIDRVYWSRPEKGGGQILKMDNPQEIVNSFDAALDPRHRFLKAYGSPWAYNPSAEGPDVEFMNLQNNEKQKLAKGQPVQWEGQVAAFSNSGKMWALANGKQVEIYSLDTAGAVYKADTIALPVKNPAGDLPKPDLYGTVYIYYESNYAELPPGAHHLQTIQVAQPDPPMMEIFHGTLYEKTYVAYQANPGKVRVAILDSITDDPSVTIQVKPSGTYFVKCRLVNKNGLAYPEIAVVQNDSESVKKDFLWLVMDADEK